MQLVLLFDSDVALLQGAEAIQPQHRQSFGAERPEISTGALHPHHVDIPVRHRVGDGSFRRRISAAVVRVATVGAEPIGTLDELIDRRCRICVAH